MPKIIPCAQMLSVSCTLHRQLSSWLYSVLFQQFSIFPNDCFKCRVYQGRGEEKSRYLPFLLHGNYNLPGLRGAGKELFALLGSPEVSDCSAECRYYAYQCKITHWVELCDPAPSPPPQCCFVDSERPRTISVLNQNEKSLSQNSLHMVGLQGDPLLRSKGPNILHHTPGSWEAGAPLQGSQKSGCKVDSLIQETQGPNCTPNGPAQFETNPGMSRIEMTNGPRLTQNRSLLGGMKPPIWDLSLGSRGFALRQDLFIK